MQGLKTVLNLISIVIIANYSCDQPTGPESNSNTKPEKVKVGTLSEAISLIENHKENEGIDVVNYLLKKSPDSASYLYFLKAMAFYKLKNFQQSMIAIEKSLSFDTLNYRSYAAKGDMFQKINRFDSAMVYYKKAEIGLPNDLFLLNNIGTLYISIGEFGFAKGIYRRIESLEPNNPDYLYNMSFAYYKLNLYDSALIIMNSAIKLRQDDYGLFNLKGQILGKMGRVQDAIKSFETSIKIKPVENNAIENLRRLRLNAQ